jgi:hypothetical protein
VAPKIVTNPLSKKALRKAAQEQKKNTKDDLPLNLSSATKATLERAKKAKEALQNSESSKLDENIEVDVVNRVDENLPFDKGTKEYPDPNAMPTEELKVGCSESPEDLTSAAGPSIEEVNNNIPSVPKVASKPD